jgi:tetratricopeptide (TPR) repeat protein
MYPKKILTLTLLLISFLSVSQDFDKLEEAELWKFYKNKDKTKSAKAAYYLGSKFFKHNYDSALILLEKSLSHFKAPNEYFYKTARNKHKVLCKLERFDEAQSWRSKIIDEQNQNYTISFMADFISSTIINLVNSQKMELANEALQAFEKVYLANKHPNIHFYYHYTVGYYNYFTGDYQMVLFGFENALETDLKDIPEDKISGTRMNIGIIHYRQGKNELAKKMFFQAVEDFKEQDEPQNLANAYVNLASVYSSENKNDSVIVIIKQAKNIYEENDDSSGVANSLEYMGNAYSSQGDFANALEYHLEALSIRKAIKSPSIVNSYVNISNSYKAMKDNKNRYKYLLLSKAELQKSGNEYALANSDGYFAQYHYDLENYDSSLYYANKKLEYFKSQNNAGQIATSYLTLGNTYKKMGKLDKALEVYNKSYDINKELGKHYETAGLGSNIGVIYLETGRFNKALKYFIPALEYRKTTDNQGSIMDGHLLLANTYDSLKRYKDAFYHLRQYNYIKDSVFYGSEMNDRLAEMRTKFETDQIQDSLAQQQLANEMQIAINENEKLKTDKAEAETAAANRMVLMFIVLSVALLAGGLFILRMANQRKKTNAQLSSQNERISKQNKEILLQKDIIQEKNREIVDSINYAKRLQDALLPPIEKIRTALPNAFVLFKPKDIVSGDFYWMEENKNRVLFSAVDCTGHGVPGAMVSVVGNNGLNRALNEFGKERPAEILNTLNEIVTDTFRKQGKRDIRDGMDMALCSLEKNSRLLEYSGANNPVYICSEQEHLNVNGETFLPNKSGKNGANLFEIKGSKQAIGPSDRVSEFVNNQVQLNKGDKVYVFSDGFADQFGGEKGKKFKYNTFKETILSLYSIPTKKHGEALEKVIISWMADYEQIDDICVFGVEVE